MSGRTRRLSEVVVHLPEGVTPPGTRGRILRAGLAQFAERGFYGTSIRDLAAEAGVNSATLYAHYPSKEHILAALVLHGHEEMHRRLQEALVRAGADPAAQLAALVHAHVLVHTDYPLLALVTNAELHALSGELALPAVTLREQSRQLLVQVLQHGVQRGVFDIADVFLTATAIAGMGMRVANWFGPEAPLEGHQVAASYADLALRMVGVGERTGQGEKAAPVADAEERR